jgi:hypothetical protein
MRDVGRGRFRFYVLCEACAFMTEPARTLGIAAKLWNEAKPAYNKKGPRSAGLNLRASVAKMLAREAFPELLRIHALSAAHTPEVVLVCFGISYRDTAERENQQGGIGIESGRIGRPVIGVLDAYKRMSIRKLPIYLQARKILNRGQSPVTCPGSFGPFRRGERRPGWWNRNVS